MLALFAILGTLALAAALYGLIVSIRLRRSPIAEAVAIAALAAAWWIGHESALGWVALAAGVVIAFVRLKAAGAAAKIEVEVSERGEEESSAVRSGADPEAGSMPPSIEKEDLPSPTAMPVPPKPRTVMPPAPKPAPGPPQVYKTIALLRDPWQASVDVLCASLRRGGERRAEVKAATQSGSPAHIAIGAIRLDIKSEASPVGRQAIEDAAAQSVDWPDALDVAGSHAAQVLLTTTAAQYERSGDSSRDAVIRAHLRAHAALAEFAPVVGIYWPASGVLVAKEAVAGLLGETNPLRLLSATGLAYRASALEGDLDGCHACGTCGLGALGLSDLEIILREEPGDAITNCLVRMVRRVYDGDDPMKVGDELPNGVEWETTRAPALLPPPREVVRFVRNEPEPESTDREEPPA